MMQAPRFNAGGTETPRALFFFFPSPFGATRPARGVNRPDGALKKEEEGGGLRGARGIPAAEAAG